MEIINCIKSYIIYFFKLLKKYTTNQDKMEQNQKYKLSNLYPDLFIEGLTKELNLDHPPKPPKDHFN